VKPGFHPVSVDPEHADCGAGGTSVTEVQFLVRGANRDHQADRHCVQDGLHRAEGFRRFAFREADPRSIPFRAVRIRRITQIR
jgi:hypothetical protein